MTTSTEPMLLPSPASLLFGKIHQGDCLEQMRQIESGTIDLAFADPPFNIGYEYDEYHDEKDDEAYLAWCRAWIEEIHRVLKGGGTFWLAIGDEYAAELKVAAQHQVGFTTRSWVVWYYTFGVNCKMKFSRSHVHLFHFVKDGANFTFNAEEPLVRIPSARALVYGDKRANPKGRLPDDTWIIRPAPDDNWVLRPQDLPDGFQPPEDTWYYARVAGTFKERQGFHGCQMPEQLLGRIIRVSSNPGDVVLDPFAGSGTTLAVAKKLGRRWLGCELSEEYARAATARLDAIHVGDVLDGPLDPIGSAPSTANGRRLKTWEAATGAAEDASIGDRAISGDQTGRQPSAPKPETSVAPAAPSESPPSAAHRPELRELIREAIVESFFKAHDGYSIDWLLVNPALQSAFHEACRAASLIGGPGDWNRELLRLRKAGAIPRRAELKKVHVSGETLDNFDFAAEIAWRLTGDRFRHPSLDEIFCDPEKAEFFDRTAGRLAPGTERADIRWAALRLRKASRELVQEVKQFHFVFSRRDFASFHGWNRFRAGRLAGKPGLYMLRTKEKRPLYIGLTLDLGQRLALHAATKAIGERAGQVAILAENDLPGSEYLEGFKQELVRRHEPDWNMNLVAASKAGLET